MAELDSLKIEKLLREATNERQRKMYLALLKKARSTEAEAAKASSGTETKVKAQAVLGKVQKPEQTSTKLAVSAAQSKVENKTNPNTSGLTAENNKKSAEKKSSKKTEKSQQQKAKSAEGKKAKKETKKKKVQDEAPIFQALGKMVLSPYLKGDDLKVEINEQEYDLLYRSEYTFFAHKRLKQQVIKYGSKKILLTLYPNVQFSKELEVEKLFFVLGDFNRKYDPERTYAETFKLRGIWQYVPESQTPVISIHRNINQWGKCKKLNAKEQLKFAQANHIPVVWNDPPVEPFKYVEEVAEDEQMPRYFVEVSVIIKDGIYVVQEILKEPILEIPRFITKEKLKQFASENEEASKEKLDNREISGEKDKSLSKTEKFQFVLRGEILTENDSEFFQVENGAKLNIRLIIPDAYPQEITDWQALPVTNNDAEIVNLILEKPLSSSELMTTPSNLIIKSGRITEVGKKDDRFKIKLKREKAKDLKITVLPGELKVKVGQLWSMKLVLKENHLYVEEAEYLKD